MPASGRAGQADGLPLPTGGPGPGGLGSAARPVTWGGEAPLSLLLLGVVDRHVVIEHDEQEERHAQHVGEDGELHIRDHPAGRAGAQPRPAHLLPAGLSRRRDSCSLPLTCSGTPLSRRHRTSSREKAGAGNLGRQLGPKRVASGPAARPTATSLAGRLACSPPGPRGRGLGRPRGRGLAWAGRDTPPAPARRSWLQLARPRTRLAALRPPPWSREAGEGAA